MHKKMCNLSALTDSLTFLTLFNVGILLIKLTLFDVGILLKKLPLMCSGIYTVLGVTVFKYLEIIKRLYCYNIRERSRRRSSFVHSWGALRCKTTAFVEGFWPSWDSSGICSTPASSALPITLNKAFPLTQHHLTCIAHNSEERVLCLAVLK